MKYTYIILLLLFSTFANAEDGPNINDRKSLQFIFERSFMELSPALTENDFFLHFRGLDYALVTLGDQSEVEWSSSTSPDLNGKVVILSTKRDIINHCKSFLETLNIKGKRYEGTAVVCLRDGAWLINIIK